MKYFDPATVEVVCTIIEKLCGDSPKKRDPRHMIDFIGKQIQLAYEPVFEVLVKVNPLLETEIHSRQNLAITQMDRHSLSFPGPVPGMLHYYTRYNEIKTTVHFGQLKLFLMTLLFLMRYARKKEDVVVYAGAAPGTNMVLIAKLFPHVSFLLIDPAPFDERLTKMQNVKVIQELFTDELARKTSSYNPLFISDIRRDISKCDREKSDRTICDDMELQMQWAVMMPRESFLKFRMPWYHGKTAYLKPKELWIQPFAGPTSTELRAVVTADAGTALFNHKSIERKMFFYNTKVRPNYFHHDIIYPGLDHCADCKGMVNILTEFTGNSKKVVSMISEIEITLGRKLCSFPPFVFDE